MTKVESVRGNAAEDVSCIFPGFSLILLEISIGERPRATVVLIPFTDRSLGGERMHQG